MLGTGTILPNAVAAHQQSEASTQARSDQALRMRVRLKPEQAVWIILDAGAGFQERLASRELARGLRKLG